MKQKLHKSFLKGLFKTLFVFVFLTLTFNANAQYVYNVVNSPGGDWGASTYDYSGWSNIVVAETGEISNVKIDYTWATDNWAYESSFHMESPTGTSIVIASEESNGTYSVNLSNFNSEEVNGTWKLWIEDAYPDGGHQATNVTVTFYAAPPAANDVGIGSINPVGEFGAGIKDVTATIQNYGLTDLTSATISWSVDGLAQTDFSWAGNLLKGETDQVTLGQFDFSTEGTYTINVNTSMPNSVADEKVANDAGSVDVTTVAAINAFPWTENFDAATAIPAGWVNELTNDEDWTFISSTTSGGGAISADNSGTGNFAYFNAFSALDDKEGILTSPLFDLSSLDNATLEFYWQRPKSDYNERLIVNVYSNGTWNNNVIAGLQNQVASWTKVELDLTPYISSGMKVQFKVISDNMRNIAIDDVKIHGYSFVPNDAGIASIDAPGAEFSTGVKDVTASIKNLGTDNLTGATISWSVNDAAQTDFTWNGDLAQGATEQVVVGSFDFASAGSYTISASTSMPNGVVDVNTTNDAYSTDVTAIQAISAFPWTEDFENAGEIPVDWVNEAANTYDWDFSSYKSSSSGGTISADNTSGSGYFAYVNCYSSDSKVAMLTSPLLDLSALTDAKLEFYWILPKTGGTSKLEVNVYSNGTWTNILNLNTQVTSWEKVGLNLTPYKSDAVKIQFKVVSDSWDKNIGLDDIRIYEPGPMVFESSTSSQTTEILPLGTGNAQLMAVEVVTTGEVNPLNVTELSFNTTGTTDIADIENARVWFTGASATFEATTQFGTDVPAPDGVFTMTGNVNLEEGTNHFWLTYDIKGSATAGNFIDAECTSVTVGGNAETPTVTAPAGNKEIGNFVLMPGGTGNSITKCGFTLYDDGGASNYYSNNFTGELTIYPENPGDGVKIEFVSFGTEAGYDYLEIYNGNSTSEPQIGQIHGYDGAETVKSTAADGSLTIKFGSDNNSNGSGWEANVTCYTVVAMEYASSTTTQNFEPVSYDTQNEHIIGIEVVASGNYPLTNITEFVLNTNGSTNVADIDTARLWYTGTSNVFATTNQFGSDLFAPDGAFTISGDTTLAEGTNYFWLTYDISVDAGRDDFIDAECDSVLVNGAYHIPGVTAPMGHRTVERTMNMLESTESVTVCDMIFYDDGGADGTFSTNFDGTTTFFPATPGAGIRFEFLELELGDFTDKLTIYNGASSNAPVLAEITKDNQELNTYESTSTDGSLTIQFESDGRDANSQGWKSKVSCYAMESMAYDNALVTQGKGVALQNSTENKVMAIEVSTTGFGFPLNITEFVLNTNGSDAPVTDIANAKLWYTGTSGEFATTTQFGTEVVSPNGQFTITGDQELLSGTNYFWLTYDIKAGASLGNVVDAECNSFIINGNIETPGVTSAQGNTIISQFYTMTGIGQEITDCGYILTDDGGVNGNYSYGFEGVVTLYPSNPNDAVVVDFTSFDMKTDYDHYLEVHNGDTVRPVAEFGKYNYYTEDPGRYMSTASDGTLTLKFVSDAASYTPAYAGFMANVTCVSTDVTLSDITLDGASLAGFDPAVITYNEILPNGTTTIPVVDYIVNDGRSIVIVSGDTEVPGSVTIDVTAENGNSQIYTINFTEELAPTAVNVMVLGTAQVGQTLTALYDYYDANDAVEGATTFKWYRADDDLGLNKTEIAGETTLSYTLVEVDLDKYITFEVTPVAVTGMLTGLPVEATVGPIMPLPSPENSIGSFDFTELDPAVVGKVNEIDFTVNLTVPYGTDLATLVPTIIVSDNATVSPASDIAQDFTNDVVYTVTAENGDEQPYTVSVAIAQNTENSILTFDFNELDPAVVGSIDEVSHIVTLLIPYGTDLATLIPTLTISDNATVSPASDVEQDFTNDVVYTVTAENGDEQSYTVSVTVESNTENKVMAFTFEELDPVVEADEIDHTKGRINITVPYGTDITTLVPTIVVSTNANISPATGVAQDFTNTVEYVVTAENGDERNYTVNLTIAPNHENSILTFDFEEFDPKVVGVIEDNTITLSVNAGADVSALIPTITLSAEATVTPASGEIQDFTNDVVYTVTAQNSDVKEYIVKVNFNTGIDNEIISITDINLYPNPSNGRFKLVISTEESEEHDVEIINIQGKVIFKSKIINEKDIDMTEFAKGIYYVRVSVKDNVVTKKILIQ